ncbi:MAG: hypothetical protein LBH93_07360 [Chitinispirillales bacterium]|jgi:uncharacterized membrane protein|nr:hypothetical protein [Chitinispirillales bacterium]
MKKYAMTTWFVDALSSILEAFMWIDLIGCTILGGILGAQGMSAAGGNGPAGFFLGMIGGAFTGFVCNVLLAWMAVFVDVRNHVKKIAGAEDGVNKKEEKGTDKREAWEKYQDAHQQ